MAEEKFDESVSDDQSVINMLLRTVRGISIVSTPPLAEVEVGTDDDSDF